MHNYAGGNKTLAFNKQLCTLFTGALRFMEYSRNLLTCKVTFGS